MTDKQWRKLVLDLWKFFAQNEQGSLVEFLKLKARVEKASALTSPGCRDLTADELSDLHADAVKTSQTMKAAILPQRMRETAAEAIRTFCKSLGNNVVVVSSDDVERIYYSGISVDALSAAIAIALTRPKLCPTEKTDGSRS